MRVNERIMRQRERIEAKERETERKREREKERKTDEEDEGGKVGWSKPCHTSSLCKPRSTMPV